jgi:RHS repeat-associated protein
MLTARGKRSSSRRFPLWFERLEDRNLLSLQPVTLADPSFYGASAAGASGAPSFSSDGQLLAFQSDAGNLTTNDFNGLQDIFVRNISTQTVTLVSATPAGISGNAASYNPILSGDGRFVLFESDATDLVPGDTNARRDVFVRDLETNTTTLVSVGMGVAAANAPSFAQAISSDGQLVVFASTATNLVSLPTNNQRNVFVRDLTAGTTTLVSANFNGTAGGNAASAENGPAVLSPDGRFVAFDSIASDLVTNDSNGETSDVFVRDLAQATTTVVSMNLQGTGTGTGNNDSIAPVFDSTGRFIAFTSKASDLVSGGGFNVNEVYMRDTVASTTVRISVGGAFDSAHNPVFSPDGRYVGFEGHITDVQTEVYARDLTANTTVLISANRFNGDVADGLSSTPVFSPDGHTVYFVSTGTNLVADNSGGISQIYARNLAASTTSLLSRNPDGTVGDGPSTAPVLTSDGTTLAFQSQATGLVAQDNNQFQDVFLQDTATGTISLASQRGASLPPQFTSRIPISSTDQRSPTGMSSDGRYVVYTSDAKDLVTNPLPAALNRNAYRYDRQTGLNELVSVNPDGSGGHPGTNFGVFGQPAISGDGRFVVFASNVLDLVPGLQFALGSNSGIFVRDMVSGTTRAIDLNTAGQLAGSLSDPFTISPNGRYVAFSTFQSLLPADGNGTTSDVYVYDLQQNRLGLVSTTPSGNAGNSDSLILEGTNGFSQAHDIFSDDGRYIVFSSRATDLVAQGGASNAIYVRDLQLGATTLISVAQDGTAAPAQGESISGDGSRVAFLTQAQLLPADMNFTFDVYIRDIPTSSYIFVSAGQSFGGSAPGISRDGSEVQYTSGLNLLLYNVASAITHTIHAGTDFQYFANLSGDGRFVAFQSADPNIAPGDTNNAVDVFLYDVQAQTITPLSLNQSGTGTGNRGVLAALTPVVSSAGNVVAFASDSDDLAPADINGRTDIFLFVRSTGQASASGEVFADTNGNGQQDPGENGLAGWTVFLDANGNGMPDSAEPQATTDSNGAYEIDGVQPGTYAVTAVRMDGFVQTAPPTATYSITVTADENFTGLDFGFQQAVTDLAVTSVGAPSAGQPGQTVTVNWTVGNQGNLDAGGGWQDAVYLSQDQVLGPSDILLSLAPHSGGLSAGVSYPGTADVVLPGVLPGDYYLLVQTDRRGQVPESDRNNDVLASTGTITLTVPTLTLDVPLADQFTAPGQFRYYQIAPPAGQTLQFNVVSAAAAGATAIFVSRRVLPTPGSFDVRAQEYVPNEQAVVAETVADSTYYVLVEAQFGAAATSSFTITADLPGLSITQVSPNQGGNSGRVTVRVAGTDFTSSSQVQLVSGATSIAATSIDFQDATLLYATFDLTGQPVGTYDVSVAANGSSAVAPGAFQIVAGVQSPLTFNLIAPSNWRHDRWTPMIVEVQNTGNTDIVAPVLRLSVQNAMIRFASDDGAGSPDQTFLAISPDGPAGILRPGQVSDIAFYFSSPLRGPGRVLPFTLDAPADTSQSIDWNSLSQPARPLFVSTEAWNVVWSNFTGQFGTTVADYQSTLAGNASYLSEIGRQTADTVGLENFALRQANDALLGAVLTSDGDLSVPTPGLSLDFGRVSLQSLSGRYRIGPLGRGWVSNWEISAATDNQGNVGIEESGQIRFFTLQPDGSYRGLPGDAAVLTVVAGVYQLRESDGDVFVFRPDDRIDYVQDPNGNRITASYDSSGNLTNLTHTSGASLAFRYDTEGRLLEAMDSTGRTAIYTYDAADEHLLTVTTSRGSISYGYGQGANPLTSHALTSVTEADGTHTFYNYDSQGRLAGVAHDAGIEQTTFTYGPFGQVTFQDALGNPTTVWFDDAGQAARVEDALGRTLRQTYDVNHYLSSVTNADGARSSFSFCNCGSLMSAVDEAGASISFSFDSQFHQLTRFVDARGIATTQDIDSNGNVLATHYADGTQQSYVHDAAGNVTQQTNRADQVVDYTYDRNGSLLAEQLPDGSSITFSYDAHGNLLTATDSNGTVMMQYDSADRLTQIEYPDGRFLSYAYDAAGHETSVNQNGFIVNYAYVNGRLTDVTNGSGAALVHYEYDSRDELVIKRLGNGTWTTYSYDEVGQLLHLVNFAADGSVNSQFDYSYDDLGRVTSVTTLDGTTTYGYDATGQLTSVVLPGGRTILYQYDAAGNRASVTDNGTQTSYTTNELNQYTSVGGATYTYDANGNVHTRTDSSGTTTYTFNIMNQLVGVTGPAGTFIYEYDALGDCIAETVNGVRHEFLVDPNGLQALVGEYDAQGNLVANYAYGLGLVGQFAVSNAYYYDFDAVGSTTGLTNSAGQYVDRYAYLPFGETAATQESVSNRFRYGGEAGVLDRGDGLLDMRQRHYDPTTGQFVSDDPLGLSGGDPNLRRYVHNSPTNFVDPDGQSEDQFSTVRSWTYQRTERVKKECAPGLYKYETKTTTVTAQEIIAEAMENDAQYNITNDVRAGAGYLSRAEQEAAFYAERANIARQKALQRIVIPASKAVVVATEICPAVDAYLIADDVWTTMRTVATRQIDITSVTSNDPNDIVGPAGFGSGNYVTANTVLYPYTIHFEDDPAHATAPAQDVTITHQLSTNLDWTAFQLGDFGFGSTIIHVPAGLQEYQTQISYHNQDGSPLRVDFSSSFDLATGIVTWAFHSIDPATGTFPLDPFAGFLPVDDSTGIGEALVTYLVRPKAGLATGTSIDQQGSIVFDTNDPVPTNVFTNTTDAGPPTSSVQTLPVRESTPSFTVNWSGQDDASGSGIAAYDIFVSDNGVPFTAFLTGTTSTSASFNGQWGHSYAFYSVAVDNVGNRQPTPGMAQATTQVAPEPFSLFVTALYQNVLNRVPAVGEVSPWVQLLVAGHSRAEVTQWFWESAEHRGIQVDGFYRTYLGRSADAAGRAGWAGALVAGMSETAVEEGFISSPEYQGKHRSARSFTDALYAQVLGRTESTLEQAPWVDFLQSGGNRRAMAHTFLTSPENDRRIVDRLYSGLLGRPADAAGENAWIEFLEHGGGNQDQAAEAFLASDEFFARVTQA